MVKYKNIYHSTHFSCWFHTTHHAQEYNNPREQQDQAQMPQESSTLFDGRTYF